ncbi:MAG: epoxyqueuosine reductase QueH [Eubacteriales bacterium]|nr:epoxyqueuosine reductase QueH [Eubacteriales bacterium]
MNRRNYQKELEKIIEKQEKESRVPRLLLHSCCAPCSSYVLEYLSRYFSVTVFYYNPNIWPEEEYRHRAEEQQRLIEALPAVHPISLEVGPYQPDRFFEASRGHEEDPEGGERCMACYRLRLEEAARLAREGGYDYFTTTLTISPMKDSEKLNSIGEELAGIWQVEHLPSDFKKKNGYRRSVELSREYGLYRQNYCGCVFSRRQQEAQEPADTQEKEMDHTTFRHCEK